MACTSGFIATQYVFYKTQQHTDTAGCYLLSEESLVIFTRNSLLHALNQGIIELILEVNEVLAVILHRDTYCIHCITAADPANNTRTLLISVPSLGVYYFLLLTLSVCLSICLSVTNTASSFLFLDEIEPFFGHQFSMTKTTKLFSSIFDLGPLTPQIFICG